MTQEDANVYMDPGNGNGSPALTPAGQECFRGPSACFKKIPGRLSNTTVPVNQRTIRRGRHSQKIQQSPRGKRIQTSTQPKISNTNPSSEEGGG